MEQAGLGARATVCSAPPTGYGPRRATAHTVRTVGEPEWLALRLAATGDPGCTNEGVKAPRDDIPALV